MKWELLLVATEVCIAFALGIVGAKLADRLSLPAEALATAAAVLLLVSVVVAAVRRSTLEALIRDSREPHARRWHTRGASVAADVAITPRSLDVPTTARHRADAFLPHSVVATIPLGLLAGMVIGAVLVPVLPGDVGGTQMYRYELLAGIIGAVVWVVYAMFRDPHLAAGGAAGYGVGLPTVVLILRPAENDAGATYGGHLAIFLALAVVLVIAGRFLGQAGRWLVKPRT